MAADIIDRKRNYTIYPNTNPNPDSNPKVLKIVEESFY